MSKMPRNLPRNRIKHLVAVGLVVIVGVAAAAASAKSFGPWSTAQKIDEIAGNSTELNTPFIDGCPHQSPDGLSFYLASNRPRYAGDTRTDLDIWVAHREKKDEPFGDPVDLGEPINTTADDFCPTPVGKHDLFFVSRKVVADVTCGLGDIYVTHRNRGGDWSEPTHLSCAPSGPNSALDEMGPSYVKTHGHAQLYFSSSRTAAQGGGVPGDIFVSEQLADDSFGPASAVAALNDAAANDIQPNVRKDGREVVFSSNRTGTLGGQDIWVATRDRTDDPWSLPVNIGPAVNTAASETRPSFSGHAEQLSFGRSPSPEGGSDIYVSTRDKVEDTDDD